MTQFKYFMPPLHTNRNKKQLIAAVSENKPMQYAAIFHGCKNVNFRLKIVIFFLFLLKT